MRWHYHILRHTYNEILKREITGYEDVIIAMIAKGYTRNEIARKLKVHRETLREFIKQIFYNNEKILQDMKDTELKKQINSSY